jgi:hypothetical protein
MRYSTSGVFVGFACDSQEEAVVVAWAEDGAVGMVRGADSVLLFVVTPDEAADVAFALDAVVAPLRRRRIEQLLAEAECAVAAIRTAVAAEPQYERGENGLVRITQEGAAA